MTMNSADSNPQWAAVFGACDAAKPHPAAQTLREAEAAGNISNVDVENQPLRALAGGDSLPDGHLPDVLLPDVPLP
jgi:hypothetical protein